MEFSVIAAIDKNRGLGKNGRIPWHLKADLEHFKAVTTGSSDSRPNAVIMGRTTWESLPAKFKPLPQRLNVVLSKRQDQVLAPDVLLARSLDEALALAEQRNVARTFVIGGGSVYAQAVLHPDCRTIYLTEVEQAFGCDTFFPPCHQLTGIVNLTPR